MSDLLANASEIASEKLSEIAALFKPGARLTLLVRTPGYPDGSRDFVLTNDALVDAIAALEIRKATEEPSHG